MRANFGDVSNFLSFIGDADSCKQIPSASQMKDTEWSTWNCILGFPVAGIVGGCIALL